MVCALVDQNVELIVGKMTGKMTVRGDECLECRLAGRRFHRRTSGAQPDVQRDLGHGRAGEAMLAKGQERVGIGMPVHCFRLPFSMKMFSRAADYRRAEMRAAVPAGRGPIFSG